MEVKNCIKLKVNTARKEIKDKSRQTSSPYV